MPTSSTIVPADESGIARAVRCLRDGGLVAIPTDTVYGLAASLERPDALQRVFAAKGRAPVKNLPILLSDQSDLPRVATAPPPALARLMAAYWPGPLTIALRARPGLPPEVLAEDGSVGVRVPDDPIARQVIAGAGGALAVTSANRSGESPATTAEAVRSQLGSAVDLILDGGPTRGGIASSVVRLEDDGAISIIRTGAIPPAELEQVLQLSK